jgi:hypothetical protein
MSLAVDSPRGAVPRPPAQRELPSREAQRCSECERASSGNTPHLHELRAIAWIARRDRVALALHQCRSAMTNNQLLSIDLATLSTVTGGAAQGPQQPDEGSDGPRTWGQIGREYTAACVTGAGQALMFGGMPRSGREAAATAAFGCVTGVGMKAVEDLSSRIAGPGASPQQ